MIQLDPGFMVAASGGVAAWWACPRPHRTALAAVTGLAFLLWLDPVAALFVAAATGWLSLTDNAQGLTIWGLLAVFVGVRFAAWPELGGIYAPLGFGFTMCRLAHYAIERERGGLPAHTILDLWAYAFFFPVQAIGPIQRFGPFLRDRDRHRWDPAMFNDGLERILFGYAKVVLGANYGVGVFLRSQVMTQLGNEATPSVILAEATLHGLGLYLSFAGCSDIAIGLGRLMGQRLPENFNHPFAATNLQVFWTRWHASLSSWCRDYVFAPVLARTRRRTLGLLASMVVLGLWHEFTLRFLIWGAAHGLGLAVVAAFRSRVDLPDTLWARVLGILLTASFTLSSFMLTRHERLESVWQDLTVLMGG